MLLDDKRKSGRSNTINIPYEFVPRDYQMPWFEALVPELFSKTERENAKRAVIIAHRRSGKDKASVNILACRALIDKPGNYAYFLPESAQARKVIWRGIGADGQRFIDHFPPEVVKQRYAGEMLIELNNGSTIQLGGSDNFDSFMGTNFKGMIFSEYALQNPAAWSYFSPILAENKGWAMFITTPRGYNHAYDMYTMAKKKMEAEPSQTYYYADLLTVSDTKRPNGQPVIGPKQVQEEIDAGMHPGLARQEFDCSFEAGLLGSYYSDIIQSLRVDKRIGDFAHDPSLPVVTGWDLGIADSTAIWFAQPAEGGIRIIDYWEEPNVPLTEWIRRIENRKFNYCDHLGPHDLEQREYTTGKSRVDMASELGFDFTVVPKHNLSDGIEQVRAQLLTCQFDAIGCKDGITALSAYERVFDAKHKTFRDTPSHNWASHAADAFRTLCMGWQSYSRYTKGAPIPQVRRSVGYGSANSYRNRRPGRGSVHRAI
ncbi:MAG: hypothetical protein CL678_08565 [Bdellovibrionaceae bacterium]|nr:hypothetical protein [Pseudobdellovibrionaceae bacterium]